MKIIGVASGNRYFNILNAEGKDDWYDSANVAEAIKNINVGDDVEYEFEESKTSEQKILTSIKKIASAVVEKEEISTVDATPVPKEVKRTNISSGLKMPFEYMKPKTPLESEQIKRLSILASVATAITALTGTIDEDNIISKMEEIYDTFYKVASV